MTSYRERVEDIESGFHAGLEYFDGFGDAIAAAASIAAEADARIAELEAALDALVGTLDAHDAVTLSCDRDGQAHCDCLDAPMVAARAALDAAIRAADIEAQP